MKAQIEENNPAYCDVSNIMDKFGKFQLVRCALLLLPVIFVTMGNINYVFVAGDLNYRCRVEKCEDANSTAHQPSWWPDTNIDRCSAPVLRRGEQVCTNSSFTGKLTTCDHWIYESNDTVVAELDLACQPWKLNTIGTAHNLGVLVAMPLFGFLSDKFGRKTTFVVGVVAGSIGYIKTFATSSYYLYIAIEVIEALFTGGNFVSAMVLLMEITGRKQRPLSGILYTYSIYIGESIFGGIAAFVPNWVIIIRIIYLPCLLFILYQFIIDESPRWLIVNSKIEEAKKSLKRIAAVNKIDINIQEIDNMNDAQMKEKFKIGKDELKETYRDIFRSKEMIKRLFVTSCCRFTMRFVFYGMMLNSVWLPGNKYLNFFLTTLMSFPGELLALFLVYKVGRRFPLMIGYMLCGIFCLISVFTPERYAWLKLMLFLMAKIVISACFSSIYTYAMELFPTSVRGWLFGIGGIAARMAGVLAPLTPILNTTFDGLPFILFGCSSIITSLLLILTPETKDMPTFDTIKQAENYRKEYNSRETEIEKA